MPMPIEIVAIMRSKLTFKWEGGHETIIPARDLRLRCRCAQCLDETSGKPLLKPETISPNIRAKHIELVGQYGFSVEWSESPCANIYNFRELRAQCGCPACVATRGRGGIPA